MAGEFTSWRELRQAMLDGFAADPAFLRMSQYSINAAGTGGSRTVMYRTLAEFRETLKWVDEMVAREEGPDYEPRVYDQNAGRGHRRW